MEETIKNCKLRYLECQKGALHAGEQLNMICVDPGCRESGLICSICRVEIHAKHKVIPMKLFLSEVAQKMKNRQSLNSNVDELLSQLDLLNQNVLFNLKEVVENLALTIKNFEMECFNTIKRIKDKIVSQVFMNDNMPKVIESIVNNEYCDADVLRLECKKLVDSVSYSEKKGLEIDIRPEKSIEAFSHIEQDIIKTIQKSSKLFIESIKKLEKTFEKTASVSEAAIPFTFSQTSKAATISITDNKVIQNANQNYDNRFALVEPELSMEQPTKFAFQVKNIANWIGFGVCLKNVLEKKAFKFDYNSIGHGSYMISSNGYSWSHSSKEDNMANKSFLFANEDIIVCQFDPVKKQLTFKKSKATNRFTLTVEIPEGDKLVPCVNLCNKGEQVEILNQIDITNEEF